MPGATFKRFLLVGAKAARPVIIVAKVTLAMDRPKAPLSPLPLLSLPRRPWQRWKRGLAASVTTMPVPSFRRPAKTCHHATDNRGASHRETHLELFFFKPQQTTFSQIANPPSADYTGRPNEGF